MKTNANWAGKEVASDVKRKLVSVFEANMLVVCSKYCRLNLDGDQRLVLVEASPEFWPHNQGLMCAECRVSLTGKVGNVSVYCSATYDDPLMRVFSDPRVKLRCELAEVNEVVQIMLKDRQTILGRAKVSKKPSLDGLKISEWRVYDGSVI